MTRFLGISTCLCNTSYCTFESCIFLYDAFAGARKHKLYDLVTLNVQVWYPTFLSSQTDKRMVTLNKKSDCSQPLSLDDLCLTGDPWVTMWRPLLWTPSSWKKHCWHNAPLPPPASSFLTNPSKGNLHFSSITLWLTRVPKIFRISIQPSTRTSGYVHSGLHVVQHGSNEWKYYFACTRSSRNHKKQATSSQHYLKKHSPWSPTAYRRTSRKSTTSSWRKRYSPSSSLQPRKELSSWSPSPTCHWEARIDESCQQQTYQHLWKHQFRAPDEK